MVEPRKWVELSIEAHPEAVDAIANVFQEHGTGGVSIEQAIQSHIEGEEEPTFEGLPVIRAYLPVNESEPAIEQRIEEALWHLQAFDLSHVGTLQRREIDEEDWAHGWKQHFHPLKIGRVVIKPSWREWDSTPDEIVVELDPGMAFGTGLHPTTHMMIEALQEFMRTGEGALHSPHRPRVLDLGTGSGILAIAAAKMGATVQALDISDVAVEVAQTNVERNGLSARACVNCGTIDAVQGQQFDLILANIIASVLAELAPSLYRTLEPEGTVLASGIVEERVGLVREAFEHAGLELGDQQQEGDWWLIAARRRT